MEIEEDIYGDSSIKFLQINMHKRKECNIEISHLIDDNTIALCQEPNVYKGNPYTNLKPHNFIARVG